MSEGFHGSLCFPLDSRLTHSIGFLSLCPQAGFPQCAAPVTWGKRRGNQSATARLSRAIHDKARETQVHKQMLKSYIDQKESQRQIWPEFPLQKTTRFDVLGLFILYFTSTNVFLSLASN